MSAQQDDDDPTHFVLGKRTTETERTERTGAASHVDPWLASVRRERVQPGVQFEAQADRAVGADRATRGDLRPRDRPKSQVGQGREAGREEAWLWSGLVVVRRVGLPRSATRVWSRGLPLAWDAGGRAQRLGFGSPSRRRHSAVVYVLNGTAAGSLLEAVCSSRALLAPAEVNLEPRAADQPST